MTAMLYMLRPLVRRFRWPIGPTEDPTLGERGLIFVHVGLGDMSLSWQCGWRTMSPIVQVFGRRQERGSARSTDRRPKSAKARSRGKLGTG